MQRVRIRFLSIAVTAISAVTASLAQSLSYLDKDYRPSSARSYAYKRVIKYKEEVRILHTITAVYGNTHFNTTGTGLYVCSLIDYFPGGEPALVANINSIKTDCTEWVFDGKVIYYYRSGVIRKTEFYHLGKLQGDVITYAEEEYSRRIT